MGTTETPASSVAARIATGLRDTAAEARVASRGLRRCPAARRPAGQLRLSRPVRSLNAVISSSISATWEWIPLQ